MPDYRPLLPWFGVVLIGLFFGNVVYGDGLRPASLTNKAPMPARPLLPLGQELAVYLPDPPAHHHRLARTIGHREF